MRILFKPISGMLGWIKRQADENDGFAMVLMVFLGILAFLFVAGLVFGIAFGFLALTSWLLMLLWNFVIAGAFGGPALGFWHAVGLVLLISILRSMIFGRNNSS